MSRPFPPDSEFLFAVLLAFALYKNFAVGQAHIGVGGLQNRQGMQKNPFWIEIGVLSRKKEFFPAGAKTGLPVNGKRFAKNKKLLRKG